MNNNYIGVDLDIFRRTEIKKLRKSLGNEGVLVFIELFITLGEVGQIMIEDLEFYADEYHVDIEFLKQVINFKNLFIITEESISIQEVLDKLSIIFEKSEIARKKAVKRWQISKNNNATAMLQHNHSNATAMQLKEKKLDKIKLEEKKEKEREPDTTTFNPNHIVIYRNINETDVELQDRIKRIEEMYKGTGKKIVLATN
jgi:hypothetical protein